MAEDRPNHNPISERESKAISAFAFGTGQNIEEFIKQITNNLEDRNRNLEALVLSFEQKLDNDIKDFASKLTADEKWVVERYKKMYIEHFNITKVTHGSVSK